MTKKFRFLRANMRRKGNPAMRNSIENPGPSLSEYRGHLFGVEAAPRGREWEGRYRIDFMPEPPGNFNLGPRCFVTLDATWATPIEAMNHATELAYAAIDAFERLDEANETAADPGLRDTRLTLRYVMQPDEGVEKQIECTGMNDALRQIRRLGPDLRHAFVLDAAGTTVLEAGRDDRIQRERPDHADWPQVD